jgi:hypothetical protein
VKYFEVAGLPGDKQLPDAFINGPVYVYNGSTIYKPYVDSIGNYPVTRFHWNHFAVNPGPELTASPLYCAGMVRNVCGPFQPTGAAATAGQSAPAAQAAVPVAAVASGAIDFADLQQPGRPLTGEYPGGTIDWGSGAWYLSGPYDLMRGQSISFNGEGPTSASFRFVSSPRQLVQLDADNGGDASATITLACDGQPSKSVDIAPHTSVSIETGWSSACSTVMVTSTNGWYTNFTNLVVN